MMPQEGHSRYSEVVKRQYATFGLTFGIVFSFVSILMVVIAIGNRGLVPMVVVGSVMFVPAMFAACTSGWYFSKHRSRNSVVTNRPLVTGYHPQATNSSMASPHVALQAYPDQQHQYPGPQQPHVHPQQPYPGLQQEYPGPQHSYRGTQQSYPAQQFTGNEISPIENPLVSDKATDLSAPPPSYQDVVGKTDSSNTG